MWSARIKLAWRGASGIKLNAAGELEVTTPAGGFTDQRPVSWQETNGQQVDVTTKYRIGAQGKRMQSSNTAIAYDFELGEYDRSRELVIDPVVLIYCGFIGGSSNDFGNGIAVDSAGKAYVISSTVSTEASFPVTVGPDLTNNGEQEAFVAKSGDPLQSLLGEIQALIDAGTLTQNQGAGLIDKINQVIVKLDSGQTTAACNQLNSFINQVNAFINNGSLTPSQGQSLIDGANATKTNIGCP